MYRMFYIILIITPINININNNLINKIIKNKNSILFFKKIINSFLIS